MRVRIGQGRNANPEAGWDKPGRGGDWSGGGWLFAGVLALLAVGGMALWLRPDESTTISETGQAGDGLRGGLEAAEKIARGFLAESDPAKRLQLVCNAEDVKARLAEYPEEALSAEAEIEKTLGHQMDGGRSVSGFVVAFPSGNLRLLEVVSTPDGPKVDWDAYARYGSASWADLCSGKAIRAVVRVFCEPATERPEPFADQSKWTCFRLSSPDMPQAALGFATVGSAREARMRQVVLDSPNYRQRFVLEIVRHEGKDEPLFEITRCLAVGWILGERDMEEMWQE